MELYISNFTFADTKAAAMMVAVTYIYQPKLYMNSFIADDIQSFRGPAFHRLRRTRTERRSKSYIFYSVFEKTDAFYVLRRRYLYKTFRKGINKH